MYICIYNIYLHKISIGQLLECQKFRGKKKSFSQKSNYIVHFHKKFGNCNRKTFFINFRKKKKEIRHAKLTYFGTQFSLILHPSETYTT